MRQVRRTNVIGDPVTEFLRLAVVPVLHRAVVSGDPAVDLGGLTAVRADRLLAGEITVGLAEGVFVPKKPQGNVYWRVKSADISVAFCSVHKKSIKESELQDAVVYAFSQLSTCLDVIQDDLRSIAEGDLGRIDQQIEESYT